MYTLTTFKQVRSLFWETFPEFKKKYIPVYIESNEPDYRVRTKKKYYREAIQNEYCTDIRVCFVDFVDHLRKDGQISDRLANNITL